ncbi:hypothetical protein ABT160_09900 [Streptomyces sp. NPDC001941]|uniref:hypothetical protein n=1 Tax=Streptomyces sp. NPDC001941 TaxID=3154659 RepID=UPI00331A010F
MQFTSPPRRRRPLALACLLLATVAATIAPAAAPHGAQAHAADCRGIGSSFSDRLLPGQCLRNGNNRLEMQYDGNLVLYSGDRACWASGTEGTDGVYAQYSGDWKFDSPYMSLESQFGQLRKYRGKYTGLHKSGDISLNGKGEVWIAYERFAGC